MLRSNSPSSLRRALPPLPNGAATPCCTATAGCACPNDTFYIEIRGGDDRIVTEKEKRRLYHAEEDEHLRAEWAARLSEDVDAEVAFYAQRNGERKACRRARRADKARRGAFIEAQLAGRRRSTKMTTAG